MSLALFTTIITVGLLGSFCTLGLLVSSLFYEERIARVEELRRQQELATLLRTAEMERLQAQIEPHFLFNTLNVLARLAYMDRGREASAGLYSLSRLLRGSIRTRSGLIPLREEMELTESYLSLQRLRFGSRLRVSVDVPADVLEVHVPPLTIQPLVENACRHGVEHRSHGAIIEIAVAQAGDDLRIVIRDNGPEPRLEGTGPQEPGLGIGLANVRQRLEYWFGAPYGLSARQLDSGGTEFILLLPMRKEVLRHDQGAGG